MSIVVDVPADLENELATEAARLGLSVPEYALRLLLERPVSKSTLRTGAEVIAFWQNEGLIGTRPDIEDSQAHARMLREQAQRREPS